MKAFMGDKEYVLPNNISIVITNDGGVLVMTEHDGEMTFAAYLSHQSGKQIPKPD